MAANPNYTRSIRLNAFQRAMFQWTSLHPYNAVHAVEIARPLNRTELAFAINSALKQIGFSEITFNRPSAPSAYSLSTTNDEIQIRWLTDPSPETLYREIEEQLNSAFLCGSTVCPFRWLAQERGDRFVLAVTYFHVLADAESIVWLLRLCTELYLAGNPERTCAPTAEATPARETRAIRIYPPSGSLALRLAPYLRRLVGIPAMAFLMRRCYRTPLRDHRDFKNRFIFFSIPGDRMRGLQSAAKSWNVTVNDLLLALLIKSVSGLASGRFRSAKRTRIAVGCIVNLRKDLGMGDEPAFGLYLGSFFVTHECGEGTDVATLARDVRRQTASIKCRRLALGTPIDLRFGRLLFSLFSTERQKKLYHRNYPLWGGVTNMNLNAVWERNGSAYADYFRAVSTGPVTPLVLSTTTAGDQLNVGLTYRTAVFADADVQHIKNKFIECVNQL